MSNELEAMINAMIDKVRWLQQEVQHLHESWKEQATENERLQAELADAKAAALYLWEIVGEDTQASDSWPWLEGDGNE